VSVQILTITSDPTFVAICWKLDFGLQFIKFG